jgi:hypothetical protein
VKEATQACSKTQQEIDAQESELARDIQQAKLKITLLQAKRDKAVQDLRFEGTGGAGEFQRSIAKIEAEKFQGAVGMEVKRTIESLKERLKAEKAIATAQSNTATRAIKDLAKHWSSFNKTVHEQRAQTEKSIEAVKKKSTAESFGKLPVLQMHLDCVQKAEQEAEVLKTQADKAKTTVAYLDAIQKIEQSRLSIASGPKTVLFAASFYKTVHEQRAQTEKSIEAAKKKSTAESFAKLPVLQMHLDRIQKAEQEAEVLRTQAGKANTTVACLDAIQKIEQSRLSIARGPKTQEELDKQPMDFGILSVSSSQWTSDDIPSSSADKFVVGKLTTGRPEEAAHGLPRYMGIDNSRLAFIMKEGLAAIRMEFEENGNKTDIELMRYVLDEVAVEKEEVAPYGKVTRDEGHGGMKLEHFRQRPDAVKAELELPHIAALRIYTSNAYKRINDPLRNGEKPHPFAATTYFLSEALKKLRVVNAQGAEAQQRKEFWRGMKVRKDSRALTWMVHLLFASGISCSAYSCYRTLKSQKDSSSRAAPSWAACPPPLPRRSSPATPTPSSRSSSASSRTRS